MKSLPRMGAVVICGLLATVVCRAQGPTTLPEVRDQEAVAQPKAQTEPKKTDKEKEKEKKPPETARETLPSEGRLDYLPRTLPRAPEILGDQPPLPFRVGTTKVTTTGGGSGTTLSGVLPGTRGFKVADNGSPRPQDRVYFSFQYYSDLYGAANQSLGANVGGISLYRESVGMEKTFLDGSASFELRLPINTLTVSGGPSSINGTHTALGDLGMALRVALWRDTENDNWLTVGLAGTAPTGPSTLGGVNGTAVVHGTVLQPFVAALWNVGDWYVQGFSAIDVPVDSADVTIWYHDIALGNFLMRTQDRTRFITAIAPAFEIHVATPLNHRGIGAGGGVGAVDEVNLGVVGNLEFYGRSRLAAGIVIPVVGPRPFNVEALVQLRMPF